MKSKFMAKDNNIFLKHILESIKIIEDSLEGVSLADFRKNITLQDAVIRRMEIIGEAVKSLDKEIIKENQKVDFIKIARMRDKLIHHYFGVDVVLVWETIKNDLPKFKKDVQEILKQKYL
jgi:uncharacterized protein with HEPN domain